jgi:DNA-binding MarR family transcriptional regulator
MVCRLQLFVVDNSMNVYERRQQLDGALYRVARHLVFNHDPTSPLIELPIAQVRCLRHVAWNEGDKMIDLANKMGIKLPTMSQNVQRLVKRGLLERHTDDGDRRVVRLALTERAKALLKDENAIREARLAAAMAQLDDESIGRVIAGLEMLAMAGERSRTSPDSGGSDLPVGTDPLAEMVSSRERIRRDRTEGVRK